VKIGRLSGKEVTIAENNAKDKQTDLVGFVFLVSKEKTNLRQFQPVSSVNNPPRASSVEKETRI
jgi:hypothetical protein